MEGCEEMKERKQKLFCLEGKSENRPDLGQVDSSPYRDTKTDEDTERSSKGKTGPNEHTTALLIFHRHIDPEKKRLPTRLPHLGMRQDKMIGLHSLLTHHRFK